jgi:hypothetical protein
MPKPPLDRGALLAYWGVKFADAVEGDDPLMADAARRQIREIGFDVRPLPSVKRPRARRAK